MEELRATQGAMKADIELLKDQVNQILKALETLKSIRETPTARGGEATFPPVEIIGKQEPFYINTHAQGVNLVEPNAYTSFQMNA